MGVGISVVIKSIGVQVGGASTVGLEGARVVAVASPTTWSMLVCDNGKSSERVGMGVASGDVASARWVASPPGSGDGEEEGVAM